MSDTAPSGNDASLEDWIALYALDALDADDRAQVERRLATDPRARALLDEFRQTIGHLHADATAVPPPPAVKARVLARVDADLVSRGATPRPESAWDRVKRALFPLSLALTAVSIVLAVGLGAWAASLQRQLAQAQQELALLQAPDLRIVSLPRADTGPVGAQANLLLSPQRSVAVLTVHGLSPLPADKTYEFWLLRGGQPIPAGTFNVDANGSGRLIVQAADPLSTFDQAGITVEPAGGSATPTLSALVSIGSIQ